MRTEYYITPCHENEAYCKLLSSIKGNPKFKIHHTTTLILNVSPDYSSIVSQRLSHGLSTDREIINVKVIDVPYPDQDANFFKQDILELVESLVRGNNDYENLIFVEAGVIRGSNYQMIYDIFIPYFHKEQLLFTALFENAESKFKCDCIGEPYSDKEQDLTFYWERDNNHWK